MKFFYAIFLCSSIFLAGCAETPDDTSAGAGFNPHGGFVRKPIETEKPADTGHRNIKKDFDKIY